MNTPLEFVLVLTSCDDRELLEALAAEAVRDGLAACVQICGPITSTYYWEGKITTSTEWQASFKTHSSQWEPLRSLISRRHSYQLPEIVAVPLVACSSEYAKWLQSHWSVANPPGQKN